MLLLEKFDCGSSRNLFRLPSCFSLRKASRKRPRRSEAGLAKQMVRREAHLAKKHLGKYLRNAIAYLNISNGVCLLFKIRTVIWL